MPADVPRQPILLLADSQLLFWRRNNRSFLESMYAPASRRMPHAAYIGASNGDVEEYYDIFAAAMDTVGVRNRRMIRSGFGKRDRAFLDRADLILLAGGEVERGWNILERTSMKRSIERRYEAGALLIGVSAGAVLLGLYGAVKLGPTSRRLFDTFKLVPFVIAAHDERREWESLTAVVRMLEGAAPGLGIPAGAGAVYHPDGTLEAVRAPVMLFSATSSGGVMRDLLMPEHP